MIELLWNNPISESKMEQYIKSLGLEARQRVLDVGCGAGEVLIRIAEHYEISGVGIDISPDHVAEAERRARGRIPESKISFSVADVQSVETQNESYHLAICIGASHAFGLGSDAYFNALSRMMPMIVPGGLLLIGEAYMKQPAAQGYREFLGDSTTDEMTHADNVATGKKLGLIPHAAWTSSEDEWDDFEWTYQQIVERKALESPDAPEVMVRLVQRRKWMDAYLQWGRDTLGFGMYLFRKTGSMTSHGR